MTLREQVTQIGIDHVNKSWCESMGFVAMVEALCALA